MNQIYKITNVRKENIEGFKTIIFNIKTEKAEHELIEWINEENNIERLDSHIKINQEQEIINLFDFREKPDFMPIFDYIDLNEILDTVEEMIK